MFFKALINPAKPSVKQCLNISPGHMDLRYKYQIFRNLNYFTAAVLAQWGRALAPQAEGWVFTSQPRQT